MRRPTVALLTALIAVAALVAPAAAPAAAHDSSTRIVVVEQLRSTDGAAARRAAVRHAPPPCVDRGYRLIGAKQVGSYRWSFKASSAPRGLSRSSVTTVLRRSFNNITNENNDCGRPDRVSATNSYLGTTTRAPNCNVKDGHNVVGFGHLPSGVLAVTCFWTKGGKITEADVKINSAEPWALAPGACHRDQPLLESTMTHEAGHVFGLDHIGESRHGRLTMSPYLDGPCNANEITLGLGDMLGLEKLY